MNSEKYLDTVEDKKTPKNQKTNSGCNCLGQLGIMRPYQDCSSLNKTEKKTF